MNGKLNSWWNPDIRPENITDYEETHTTTNETGEEQAQTETYKFIKMPIIIDKVLNELSFIWTHAGCVWYNRLANRTVKDELDALNAKLQVPDYTQIIFTITAPNTSWTATENCYLVGTIYKKSADNEASITINDALVCYASVTGNAGLDASAFIPVKKGQVIKTGSNGLYNIKIYGIL